MLTKDQNELPQLVSRIRETERRVLKYLMIFLNELSKHSDITLMEVSNLAIVFGPNIIRRTTDNFAASTFLETPIILKVTEYLIEGAEDIFPDL